MMDKEEILNALEEVRYELIRVKIKLDNLFPEVTRYEDIYPELDCPVHILKELNDELLETIEIEKWAINN